jgi:rhodanese-related sulfurtransferase
MASMTGVETISRLELKWKLDRAEPFVLIETLPEEDYRRGHLPGAINVPPARIAEIVPELVPDRATEIVVYCSASECSASAEAARELAALGYESVRAYEGGKKDWIEHALPMEAGLVG